MTDRSDPRLVSRLTAFASASGVFSAAVGLTCLAGWTFGIALLLTWGGSTTIAPNSAACLVLAGLSLWLLRKPETHFLPQPHKLAAQAAAAIIGLTGLLTLSEHLFALDLRIDSLLLASPPALHLAGARIRMSPVGAGAYVLLSLALLKIDWRTRRGDWPAQFLCLGVMIAPTFGLLGLALGPAASPITLAWPTIMAFFALAGGLISSRASWALGGLLTSSSSGARILRKTVPAALLILGLVGWSISKPLFTDAHLSWVEGCTLAIVCAALLTGFITWMSWLVDRGDAQREKVQAALKLSPEQLLHLTERLDEPESEAVLRRRVTAGFGVAVLLTALLGFFSWRNAQSAAEDAAWVAHTHEVMTTLEATLRHLVDVETGGRGFAFTGSAPFLEPYETGRVSVGQDLQALRLLLADNSDQQSRLAALAEQANARIKASAGLVAVRQTTGKTPSVSDLEPGKAIMDTARGTIGQMEAAEKQLLEQRSRRTLFAQRFSNSVILLGSFLGMVFLTIAGATVTREIAISARARSQVSLLNSDLERRVAQRTAALSEAEGRLAGIIQSAMDAIITVDDQQRILVFNSAAEDIFRCPAAEALGKPVSRFIPQRFHAAHAGHIRKFGQNGATARAMGALGALWAVRADGEEFQIEASISHVVTDGKKLFTVILRDVTERVQAEAVREHLAAVVDSSDDAIISKDLNGIINAWNRGAEKIFGYPAAEVMGKPMLLLFPPDRVSEESDILARIRKGESVQHFETVRVRKDGRKIDVSVTISPIKDSRGAIVGASKIARDTTERKRAEQQLRESEENYRTLWNSMDEGFCTIQLIFDADNQPVDFRFLDVNPAFEKQAGIANAAGRSIREIDAQHEEYWFQIYGKIALTGEPARFENFAGRLHRWFDIYAFRIGEPRERKVAVLFNDITGRKRVEEALREQAQIMDSAQVFVRDMQSRVVYWPKGAEKLYGFTPQEAVGILSHDLFHTQFPEPLDLVEKKLLETGLWEGELIHTRRDGTIIIVSSAWVLHRDSQGRPVRILETNTDITARKKAEQELAGQAEELSRQAEELTRAQQALETQKLMLQSVLDSMAEGLVAADEQGKFIIWNPAAVKILGLGATSLSSQEWTAHYGLYLPDTVTPFPADQLPLVRAIRGEASTAEMFVRNPELDHGVWIEASAGPLIDKDGAVRGGVVAFRDITQRRAAEREIRTLNDELEQRVAERTTQLEAANKELEAFTYSVSHDLRAPLRHISGFSKLLLEEFGPTLPPEGQHHLQRIQDGVRRMGLLVDDLLNLGRVGRQELRLQVTGLNSVVEEVIAEMAPDYEGRKVEWKIGSLPFVECDPGLLKNVFQNLLSNAVKYTRPRPQAIIEIGQTQENGNPVVYIRDNGVGFSMKYANKLFGVFQRLHRAEDFEGTGVGLATIQRIIHKHGGRIWAEAELDKGAVFYFTLAASEKTEIKAKAATTGDPS